ncbi:WhiB family transcriptional regulator [Ornithinimicrobium sp. LYQ92]|uniref:WhiB family transcriptional regulator n=1 Tax=Serinicoccus sp. LYQ92 TaxID=3378798 RepID=UPI003852F70E
MGIVLAYAHRVDDDVDPADTRTADSSTAPPCYVGPRAVATTPEWEALWGVRARVEAAGDRIPCDGDPRHTSDDPRLRAEAIEVCRPCPIFTECAAAAASTRERFGVWASRDFRSTAATAPRTSSATSAA